MLGVAELFLAISVPVGEFLVLSNFENLTLKPQWSLSFSGSHALAQY